MSTRAAIMSATCGHSRPSLAARPIRRRRKTCVCSNCTRRRAACSRRASTVRSRLALVTAKGLWPQAVASPHRKISSPPRSHRVGETRNKSITVRHSHLGQRLGGHRVVFADQLVLRQNIGGQRIYLVVGECHRLLPWHRPPDIVEHCWRVWPEI